MHNTVMHAYDKYYNNNGNSLNINVPSYIYANILFIYASVHREFAKENIFLVNPISFKKGHKLWTIKYTFLLPLKSCKKCSQLNTQCSRSLSI